MSVKRKADELENPLPCQEIIHSPKRSKTSDSNTTEVASENGIKDQNSSEDEPQTVRSIIIQALPLIELDHPHEKKDPTLEESNEKEMEDKQQKERVELTTDLKEKTSIEESSKENDRPSERVSRILSSTRNDKSNEGDASQNEEGDAEKEDDNDDDDQGGKEQEEDDGGQSQKDADDEIEKEEPEEADEQDQEEDDEENE